MPLQLTLLSFPSLEPIAETIHVEKDIYDASFSKNNVRAVVEISSFG